MHHRLQRFCLTIAVIASVSIGMNGKLGAQATFGSIIGTVTDPAGAVVSGAKVTITSLDRGTVVSTLTNESGDFSQTHFDPRLNSRQVAIEAIAPYQGWSAITQRENTAAST